MRLSVIWPRVSTRHLAPAVVVAVALAFALALALGCQAPLADTADEPDAQSTYPDPGGPHLGDPPVPDCAGLDALIALDLQVQANAGAARGVHPLVLAHGFMGFDEVGPLAYFNGADDALRAQGFAAYVTAVPPVGSSERVRGPELARQVACIARASGAGRVNLVGHSQGGIDARVVASSPYAAYLASVTTVATPHRGTLLADAALGLVPGVADPLADAIADLWGSAVGAPDSDAELRAALEQLSEDYQAAFNAAHPDDPSLAYFSWGGRSVRTIVSFDYGHADCADGVLPNPQARDVIDSALYLPWEFLNLWRGVNDGLVSMASAKWGTFMGCIPADHGDQIGLLAFPQTDPVSGFNHGTFFVQVASELESRGL